MSADVTANPSQNASSENTRWSASVVPEITAVSNPKSNPPRAATSALKTTEVREVTGGTGDGKVGRAGAHGANVVRSAPKRFERRAKTLQTFTPT
ncbi:hypothetical protein tb265_26980 [Gemmatimonadetes bacterium T265]|nr:hypothetical protein tb265_26980 [Gemmatimonadetes bacterium T265]